MNDYKNTIRMNDLTLFCVFLGLAAIVYMLLSNKQNIKYYELPPRPLNLSHSADNQIPYKRRKLFDESEANLRGHEKLFGPLRRQHIESETPNKPPQALHYVKVRDRSIGTDDWDMDFRSYNLKRNPGRWQNNEIMRSSEDITHSGLNKVSLIQPIPTICDMNEFRDRKERFYDNLDRLRSPQKSSLYAGEKLKVVPEDSLPYKRSLPEINPGSLFQTSRISKRDDIRYREESKAQSVMESNLPRSEAKQQVSSSLFGNSIMPTSSSLMSSLPAKPQSLFEGNDISNIGETFQRSKLPKPLKINISGTGNEFQESDSTKLFQPSGAVMSPEAKTQAFSEPKTPTFSHSQHSMFSPVVKTSKSKASENQTSPKNLGSLFSAHHQRSPSIFELPKPEACKLIKPVPERAQPSISQSSNLFLDSPPTFTPTNQGFSLFSSKPAFEANKEKSDK